MSANTCDNDEQTERTKLEMLIFQPWQTSGDRNQKNGTSRDKKTSQKKINKLADTEDPVQTNANQ